MLQCVAVCCSVLQCVAVCCIVTLCLSALPLSSLLCCSVLQRVAVCCTFKSSLGVLHSSPCVAVCCSVLQCVALQLFSSVLSPRHVLCCSMLQHVAACCSMSRLSLSALPVTALVFFAEESTFRLSLLCGHQKHQDETAGSRQHQKHARELEDQEKGREVADALPNGAVARLQGHTAPILATSWSTSTGRFIFASDFAAAVLVACPDILEALTYSKLVALGCWTRLGVCGCDASRCNGVDKTLPCLRHNTLPCLTGVVVGGRECPLRPQRLSFLLSPPLCSYRLLLSYCVLLPAGREGDRLDTPTVGYTNQTLHTPTGHAGAVYSLSIGMGDSTLLTGASDGSIRAWDLRAILPTAPPAGCLLPSQTYTHINHTVDWQKT